MSARKLFSATIMLTLAAATQAQSATAALTTPSSTIAPGATIPVALELQYASGNASAGVFGAPGLYGFGGTVSATGNAASAASSSGPIISPSLPFGAVASTNAGPELLSAAGGRGFQGGIADGTVTAVSFDVTIDPDATGTVTLAYDGAVVLALDDALVTFASQPGLNQQPLTSSPLELTISTGRLCGDVNGDGLIDAGDFFAWVNAFGAQNLIPCDVNNNQVCDGSDFFAWVSFFGNPGTDPGDCQPIP